MINPKIVGHENGHNVHFFLIIPHGFHIQQFAPHTVKFNLSMEMKFSKDQDEINLQPIEFVGDVNN